ncbi:MAG TPA: DUF6519 domain-containing protein [Longimicrobiales bacterium]
MKTDISKLSFDELKQDLGVYLQMGRVQLDSDWNEQAELWLRRLQRQGADTAGTGSPNHGFRVDVRILLDALDSREGWAAEPALGDPVPQPFIDYFDHRTGVGSLSVEGAVALVRALERPLDLSGLAEVVIAVKGAFAAGECVFFLGQGGTRAELTTVEDAAGVDGWRIFRADPTTLSASIDLAAVDAYGFTGLNKAERYTFDSVRVDLPIREPLVAMGSARDFDATAPAPGVVPEVTIHDDDRIWRSTALRVTRASAIAYALPAVRDLRPVRRLVVAARTVGGGAPTYDLTLVDATTGAQEVTLAGPAVTNADGWEIRSYALPQTGIDWSQVASVRWDGLDSTATYLFAPVLIEMALDGNLVIMGGDGTAEGAGRFYGDGLAAVKASHETYFNQRDLPAPDPAPLAPPADGMCRADLAYLDLWERPVTYIEDPELREIALEGPDTTTRTRLVAQVRLLTGTEVPSGGAEPEPPLAAFHALPATGGGTLTTKDNPAAVLDPCADPCEPAVVGTFVGEENRLFRVEIHEAGGIGAAGAPGTARFKWSRENAAVACPLIVNADAGTLSVRVEQPELFRVGDLIEIGDDLDDLITGPHTDRRQTRGELRRITAIDLEGRLLSWEEATAPDPAFHAPLGRDYRLAYHAKVRRWDGILDATPGDIVLDDGVVIELGGADMIPGDFWVFTTRVADRSVERLIEAPARGIRHRYYELAVIRRCTTGGQETVVVEDRRPTFRPLPELHAADIAFDPSACIRHDDPTWAQVGNVQEAIDAICRVDLAEDIKLHNRMLHGHGVVCGLKVRCNSGDRREVIVETGYALDCDGAGIHVRSNQRFDIVGRAEAAGLLDTSGNGEVCLTIGRDVTQDAAIDVEASVPQSFWDSVLEGTLLLDFYEHCIESLLNFLKQQFLPFPATAVPVPDSHRRVVSFLNLLWQFVNPSTGQYVFLSKAGPLSKAKGEHDYLEAFYHELRSRIASETFCGMFDAADPFPAYPYEVPPGIDTAFGHFRFHARLRLHPDGRYAYTCGGGNFIHVYDLSAAELVAALEFPGGENVEVQDVAFSADGREVYAVGLLDEDSVFATATIDGDGTHTWGPTSMVCDIEFVTLATSPAAPKQLLAIGKSRGLFILDPAAIAMTPTPAVAFNATGLLATSEKGDVLYAAENGVTPPGTAAANFTRIRSIDLTNLAGAPIFFNVTGTDLACDVIRVGDTLYVTGDAAPGHTRTLWSFNATDGTNANQADLGFDTPTRLAALPAEDQILITLASENKVVRTTLAADKVDPEYRIPVQIMPAAIAATAKGNLVAVLNFFSNTLSIIDVATVTATSPPAYTAEPPLDLADYRQDIIDAYTALVKRFGQYLKDCFCDQFLVDCPECGPDDKVYLGCVEIRNGQVYHICNFTKRHYVKSFRTYGYWLSTIPILPLVKQAFAKFCCTVLEPGP